MTIVALMLCTSFMVRAQVEQTAQEMAENEHKKFAAELPNAFVKGNDAIFGYAKMWNKQFLLEENATTFSDYLGWDKRKFSQKTLSGVFKALSEKAKPGKNNANPVTVTIDFPAQPSEVKVTIKKNPRDTPAKKETEVTYVVTTRVDVKVEAGKDGVQPSIAMNSIGLVWEGKLNLLNGAVNEKKKNAPPVLRAINFGSPAKEPAEPKEEQMRARAKELIEEYYRNLQSTNLTAVLAPEIPNKAEVENWLLSNRKIVVEGNINVPLPDATSQSIVVRNVPGVTIYVDPAPYMTEDISRYSKTDAYHQLALTFTVDFKADKITKVEYNGQFVAPELAPIPVAAITVAEPVQQQPVQQSIQQPPVQQSVASTKGKNYMVQILLQKSYKPLAELPQKYRVDNVIVEKYSDGYYRYVVPAGNTLSEALAVLRQMLAQGIEDAWIAVYEDGDRVRPPQGRPETVNR